MKLQVLLDAPEPLFSAGIEKLEKSTGNSGVDVRLLADLTAKAHDVMRQLKMDTKDTTAEELYFALNSVVYDGRSEQLLIDTDYTLLLINRAIVSFNLIDVIENAHHRLPFKNRLIAHAQRGLRGELVGRYLDHIRTDTVTTKALAKMMGLLPESDKWYNHKRFGTKIAVKSEEKELS